MESLRGRDYSEDLSVDGKIILKLIKRKEGWRMWIEIIWIRKGTGSGVL
jgi:hypothetical protein